MNAQEWLMRQYEQWSYECNMHNPCRGAFFSFKYDYCHLCERLEEREKLEETRGWPVHWHGDYYMCCFGEEDTIGYPPEELRHSAEFSHP